MLSRESEHLEEQLMVVSSDMSQKLEQRTIARGNEILKQSVLGRENSAPKSSRLSNMRNLDAK